MKKNNYGAPRRSFSGLLAAVSLIWVTLAPGALAASVAADDASNYSSFTGGAVNGGTGFGAWTISPFSGGDQNGTFLNTSSIAISTGMKAWGFYANSGQNATALRPFTGSLTAGQVFQVDLQFQGIDSGNSCGFELRQSNGTARWRFKFRGGQSNCEIDDNAGSNISIGAGGFPSAGFRVVFRLITTDTYEVTVLSGINGAAIYRSNTRTLMGTSGQGIDRVNLFANNPGSVGKDAFFNNMKIGYNYPTISAQPSATTSACSGSTTPAMTVTAASTDGSALSYAWRKRGNSWGKTWTISGTGANNGIYIGAPNGANGQGSPAIGNNCWTLWAINGGSQTAYRPLVSTLAVNQSVAIDMQHGSIQSGTASTQTGIPFNSDMNGFTLTDGSGNAYFGFQFVGGQADYTIYDNSSNTRDTGIPYANSGVNVIFTLLSSTTYSCQIKRLSDGATTIISGTLKSGPSGGIQRIYLYANNPGNFGDVFFNNLVVAGADDNAGNYGGTWATGNDFGQRPLADASTGNGSSYSGSATASFTITSAATADSASYDCAVMSGQGYTTISSASTLTVNPLPTAYAVTGGGAYCSGGSGVASPSGSRAFPVTATRFSVPPTRTSPVTPCWPPPMLRPVACSVLRITTRPTPMGFIGHSIPDAE